MANKEVFKKSMIPTEFLIEGRKPRYRPSAKNSPAPPSQVETKEDHSAIYDVYPPVEEPKQMYILDSGELPKEMTILPKKKYFAAHEGIHWQM